MIAGSPIASSSVADAPGRFNLVAYLDANAGSYTITGKDVDLLVNRLLTASKGAYTVSGKDVELLYIIATLVAQKGSYNVTGRDADLLFDRLLDAAKGAYTLTGYDADLIRALGRAKLAKISVSRSGTSATVTLENFESGDLWNIYRAEIDSSATGTYTKIKDSHSTSSYSDSGLTSGTRYKWRAAITYTNFGEQEKSRPRFSNV